jgi:hypothetical protein
LWHGKIYCGDVYHGQGDANQFSDQELIDWINTSLGRLGSISRRCFRSLLSLGPSRQFQGSPVAACHSTVSHSCGTLAFLARAAADCRGRRTRFRQCFRFGPGSGA